VSTIDLNKLSRPNNKKKSYAQNRKCRALQILQLNLKGFHMSAPNY